MYVLGCGVNLDNESPTESINGLIRKLNETQSTAMKDIQSEVYFASLFNEIERLYNAVQKDDTAEFYEQYYKYWLHRYVNWQLFYINYSYLIFQVFYLEIVN